jgi:hypothetical protein
MGIGVGRRHIGMMMIVVRRDGCGDQAERKHSSNEHFQTLQRSSLSMTERHAHACG